MQSPGLHHERFGVNVFFYILVFVIALAGLALFLILYFLTGKTEEVHDFHVLPHSFQIAETEDHNDLLVDYSEPTFKEVFNSALPLILSILLLYPHFLLFISP